MAPPPPQWRHIGEVGKNTTMPTAAMVGTVIYDMGAAAGEEGKDSLGTCTCTPYEDEARAIGLVSYLGTVIHT